jgi:hypothetical protein
MLFFPSSYPTMKFNHSHHQKSSEDILRELIFINNGFYLPRDAEFSDLASYTPLPDDPEQRDTVVKVSIPKGRWSQDTGEQWLRYKRLNLADIPTPDSGTLVAPGVPFTAVSLLPAINAYYDILLQSEDIVDTTYPIANGPFILQAASTSLAWEGQLSMPVTFDLSDLIQVTALNAFHPHPSYLAL